MQIIRNRATEPEFNLALEEYLTEHLNDDAFMLWRNSQSVIFGRNQNPWAELDLAFTAEHGIKTVRRMTGGGAVFHDLGNVNFSFIKVDGVKKLDFASFIDKIVTILSEFGIKAEADGRNDIIADGLKISGNAQLIRKRADGREVQLHHGTLLFDADMSRLAGALRVNPVKLKSKGVASVRARVGNIRRMPSYCGPEDAGGFLEAIESHAETLYGVTPRDLSDGEKDGAEALAEAKYRTWDWNFGASPSFDMERTARTAAGTLTVMLSLASGKITEARIFGDFFALGEIAPLERALTGAELTNAGIISHLEKKHTDAADHIAGMTNSELAAVITEGF